MKRSLLLLAICLIHNSSYAQFFLESSASYGIPVFKTFVKRNMSGSTTGYFVHQGIYASFGGGTGFEISGGYILNDLVTFAVGFSHSSGTPSHSELIDTTAGLYHRKITQDYGMRISNVTPTVGLKISRKGFCFWMNSGVIIGMGLKMSSVYVEELPGSAQWVHEDVYSGRIAWGFSQTVGCHYEVMRNLSVGLKLNGTFQFWTPRYGEKTRYEYHSSSQPPQIQYNISEYEFVDHFVEPDLNAAPGSRGKQLKTTYSLSAISIGVSVKYVLDFHD